MLSDLCFKKITTGVGREGSCRAENGSRETREEGSQKSRRIGVGAKKGIRSKWSFIHGVIEGRGCSP